MGTIPPNNRLAPTIYSRGGTGRRWTSHVMTSAERHVLVPHAGHSSAPESPFLLLFPYSRNACRSACRSDSRPAIGAGREMPLVTTRGPSRPRRRRATQGRPPTGVGRSIGAAPDQERYVSGGPTFIVAYHTITEHRNMERRHSSRRRRTVAVNIGQTRCYSAVSLVQLNVGSRNGPALPEPLRIGRERWRRHFLEGTLIGRPA